MPKAANQKQNSASVMEMDAGKFLRVINTGARSQLALFEDRIRKMGREVNAEWRLISLDHSSLMFEDGQRYFRADIARLKHGNVKINSIREVKIVESKKEGQYRKNVLDLVNCLAESDNKGADTAFTKITAQKFRSRVIPENNLVTTRDGITRKIHFSRGVVNDEAGNRIVNAVCEALKNKTKVNRGKVVEATFGESTFKFPVDEFQRRQIVAGNMKLVATNAYLSEGFQSRVRDVAALVSQDKLEEAVKLTAEFLVEEQEFSLLSQLEIQQLIGLALSTRNIMNEELADNVGKLFFRTNCKINQGTIVKEWKETAKYTEHAPLVEAVRGLANSKQFEEDYQNFLHKFFVEDVSTKAAEAQMYLVALKQMRNILSGGVDTDLVDDLDMYISTLEEAGEEVDDATLMEIKTLVASTSERLRRDIESLGDYTEIPGEEEEEEFGEADLGGEGGEEGLGGMGAGAGAGGPDLPFGEEGEGEEGLEGLGEEGEGEEEGEEEFGGEEEEFGGEEEFGEEPGGRFKKGRGLFAASKKNPGNVLSEKKQKCSCGGLVKEGVCAECGMECVGTGGVAVAELKEAVAKTNAKDLKLELTEWLRNGEKYFQEDGLIPCTVQLQAYIEHANKLKAKGIAEGFERVLITNTPIEEEKAADPYAYEKKVKGGVRREYVSEDHTSWKSKMKQLKPGGQMGGSEPAKGDAMGCQDEPCSNVDTKAGHKSAILSKGSKTLAEGLILCGDCKGEFDMAECMTRDGAVCPECGAGMHSQLMEALAGCGHQMDRISGDGGGIAAKSLTKSDGRGAGGGGADAKMDAPVGKGVATKSASKSDGRSGGGGSKDGMDQSGKSVSGSGAEGKVKGLTEGEKKAPKTPAEDEEVEGEVEEVEEVEEDQYKDPTRRRRMAQPVKGRATLNATESKKTVKEDQTVVMVTDQPMDDVISNIAASISEPEAAMPDEGELEGELPGEEDVEEMPGEGVEELGGDEEFPTDEIPEPEEGGEGEGAFPPVGDEEGEFPPVEGEGEEEEGEEEEGEEEEGEEEEEVEEGKLPEHLKKFKFGKKEKPEESEEEGTEETEKEASEASEVSEDNDVTQPTNKKYEVDARKDGDGGSLTNKPSFKETDVAGGNVKPARPNND